MKCKKGERTCLKSHSWSVEQPTPGFQPKAVFPLHCSSLPPLRKTRHSTVKLSSGQLCSFCYLTSLNSAAFHETRKLLPATGGARLPGTAPSTSASDVLSLFTWLLHNSAPTHYNCSTAPRPLPLPIYWPAVCARSYRSESQESTNHQPCPSLSAPNT